jgi:hypothetical protein
MNIKRTHFPPFNFIPNTEKKRKTVSTDLTSSSASVQVLGVTPKLPRAPWCLRACGWRFLPYSVMRIRYHESELEGQSVIITICAEPTYMYEFIHTRLHMHTYVHTHIIRHFDTGEGDFISLLVVRSLP